IQRKAREAQDRITSQLKSDWESWHALHPSPPPMPTTNPDAVTTATADAGDYASFQYLQRLAAEVQRQSGVLPVIGAINQYSSAKELSKVDSIGNSFFNQLPFGTYATELAADSQVASKRDNSILLKLYQPSQLLRDPDGSTYLFRLTGALPSASPQSINEVADAVARD